ncbi:MAG: hypothetical protein FWD67_00380 [Betaproteobacteria bacterium]|nr:hypothetical protein [Betaproteobacteria bacterium]
MKHSLVINSQGLDIWRHTASGIELEMKLDADDKRAWAKFQDWLVGERRRCALVADLPDERHAIERLPHTSRTDRLQLIERKLAQRFPDAAFTSAVPLPVAPKDGAAKLVLLSALPRSSSISIWLDMLGETGIQGRINVPRLTSVPFLVEHWYCRQRTFPPQCLLLALGAGGMRQIFFRQRRLAFSRVITAKAATFAGSIPAYRDELTQTLAWLPSQRLVEGTPPILVLAVEADFPLLRELIPSPNSAMDFIDIARCSGGDTDILSLALRETRHGGSPNYYDCPQLRRVRQFTAARRAIWAITVTTFAIGLASAAARAVDAAHLRQETEQLIAEQRKLQNELEKLGAEAIAEPSADFPDDWFDKAENLVRDAGVAPIDILQAVAGLLDKAPWARLESLAWKKLPTQGLAESVPSASIELEISLTDNEPPQTAADRLASSWQQQHGSAMKAHIEPGMARLRLDTTLALPSQEKVP